jgi:hypothetical protein
MHKATQGAAGALEGGRGTHLPAFLLIFLLIFGLIKNKNITIVFLSSSYRKTAKQTRLKK